MTYWQFLAIFLAVPVAGSLWLRRPTGREAMALAGLAVVAVLYTGPWDSLIIRNGVWSYPASRVTGIAIAHVPLEEYAFYVFQVVLTGSLALALLNRRPR
jgi:lycopene cyclase domain-containing protein